ncbi:MAG: TIGR01777 family protein [Acidobacteria bacterium RIFCSPLOWO2_12_FULL_65_11]|nr:MAG: TIGR01777 family protein [Acidobacteria bacterium RIFCSPLOWO2_12_FULL_65_11]
MSIVIAGGTGFLGRPLATRLIAEGHDVVILTRGAAQPGGVARPRLVPWTPDGEVGPWAAEIDGAGAVINLAGVSIAGHRWTAAHKQRVLDSRVRATRSIVAAIRRASTPPSVFISGSAVGYYGPHADEIVTEATAAGADFLAGVCVQWEAAANLTANASTRLICLRTGLVLDKSGGALPQMLPPFRFGVGGPVGSGRQYWPWIHYDDWLALVLWIIDTPAVSGPLNATAPVPVPNADFARALGRALGRPALLPTPALALRLLLGEMADALLLSGQRALPAKAERLGFSFRYPRIDDALRAIFAD